MEKTEQKPCIDCGKLCDIYPIELGDFATLTFLRLCSTECLFNLAYDYLYDLYEHKNFSNKLWEMQNEEDNILRDKYQKERMDFALEALGKSFKANPQLLSTPTPNFELFKNHQTIPANGGKMIRFKRFKRIPKSRRLKNQKEYIKALEKKLQDAMIELEEISNEK